MVRGGRGATERPRARLGPYIKPSQPAVGGTGLRPHCVTCSVTPFNAPDAAEAPISEASREATMEARERWMVG